MRACLSLYLRLCLFLCLRTWCTGVSVYVYACVREGLCVCCLDYHRMSFYARDPHTCTSGSKFGQSRKNPNVFAGRAHVLIQNLLPQIVVEL